MNNEAMDILCTRRSIRKFKTEQIKDEELNNVLKAGTYAPTGMGTQEPIIVAVQDPETRERISRLNASISGGNYDPYYGAPTVIIVFAGNNLYNRDIAIMDCSAVTTNMLNAAHACGLGGCWINRPMAMFETEEGKKLLNEWKLSDSVSFGVASIALGYPDCDNPEAPPRKENYTVKI